MRICDTLTLRDLCNCCQHILLKPHQCTSHKPWGNKPLDTGMPQALKLYLGFIFY